jgi:hypothetical protein
MQPFLAMITPLASSDAHPEHPIAPGGPPPGIWPSPGHPAHPIAPGGPPPGIWPSPGYPAHPIVIPPTKPDEPPLVIWGGGNEPFPTPPIELPPDDGTAPPVGGDRVHIMEWHTAWTEQTGWMVVGVPQGKHPTPSKK